jgi:hypothetical protein
MICRIGEFDLDRLFRMTVLTADLALIGSTSTLDGDTTDLLVVSVYEDSPPPYSWISLRLRTGEAALPEDDEVVVVVVV